MRTPLYEKHLELGGRMIDFGGWELPVQYTGIIWEHEQVRSAAGIFDVSHMGEISVKGPAAGQFIQKLITNDISGMREYQAMYSPMCYPDGGTVDDLLVYKYSGEDYLLIVNASNTGKDFDWMGQNIESGVHIENVSDRYAQIAIQGPKAGEILQKSAGIPLKEIRFYHFRPEVMIHGMEAIISRTGYTGEDGFEIYVKPENAPELWDRLLSDGREEGLVPAGLGARDTLRFEAALPLYGHEISRDISPLEAGLGRFVKLDKESFIGREALARQKEEGLKRRLVGFEMVERAVARSRYEVCSEGRNIGFVTTGSYSPTLDKNLGMALIEADCADEDARLEIMVRNKAAEARIIRLPFYSKKYKK